MGIQERKERARTFTYRQQTDHELWLQTICRRFLIHYPNVIEPRVFIAPDDRFEPGIDGYYWYDANRIDFRESYFNRAELWALDMLMRHELIHAWTWFNALEDDNWHGAAFQSMADHMKVWYDQVRCRLPRRLA